MQKVHLVLGHIPLMVAGLLDPIIRNPALLMAISMLGAFIFFSGMVVYGHWNSEKERREFMFVVTVVMVCGMGYIVGIVFFG